MFIVIESYDQNDPRLVPEIEFLNQYQDWMFEIAYIKPENVSKVDFSKINYKEVPENIARACRYTNADDQFRLGLIEGSAVHQDLIVQSTEKHSYKPKVYYSMTDKDKKELVEFLKVEMGLFLNHYYSVNGHSDFRSTVESEISQADTVEKCRVLMHNRFGVSASNKMVDQLNLGPSKTNLTQ